MIRIEFEGPTRRLPYDKAQAWHDGHKFRANNEITLAQKLVEAGVADQEFRVYDKNRRLRSYGPSLHRLAQHVVRKSHGWGVG